MLLCRSICFRVDAASFVPLNMKRLVIGTVFLIVHVVTNSHKMMQKQYAGYISSFSVTVTAMTPDLVGASHRRHVVLTPSVCIRRKGQLGMADSADSYRPPCVILFPRLGRAGCHRMQATPIPLFD